MKSIAPILIGLAIVVATVLGLLRLSSRSWVEVEKSDDSSDSAKAGDPGELDAGVAREEGSRPGGPRAKGSASGVTEAARRPGGGPGGPAGSAPGSFGHAGAKGSAAVIGGQERRGGGVVGDPVGARAREGASGVSVAQGSLEVPEAARERRGEVSEFLGQVPPGGAGADPAAEVDADGDGVPDENAENEDGVLLSVPLTRDRGTAADDATPPLAEQDLTFADDGVGVKFTPDSVLAFPNAGNLKGDAATMALEIEPEWAGGDEGDYSLVNVRNANDPRNLLRLFKNGKYLRYIYADSSGEEREVSYDMSNWEPGESHDLVINYGESATALYVDGELAGQNTYANPLEIPPGTPLFLGSDVPEAGAKGAGGIISNFKVYGSVLTPGEILNRSTSK